MCFKCFMRKMWQGGRFDEDRSKSCIIFTRIHPVARVSWKALCRGISFWKGGNFFWNILSFFLFWRNWNWEKIIIWNFFGGRGIFLGWGIFWPLRKKKCTKMHILCTRVIKQKSSVWIWILCFFVDLGYEKNEFFIFLVDNSILAVQNAPQGVPSKKYKRTHSFFF